MFPIRSAWSDRPGWSGFHTPRPGNSDGLHHGFDYYCPEGTPIYATGNGVVKGRGSGFGPTSFGNNTTIWYDGNPIVAATYAHMNALPLHPVGTRVTANTIIGYVGHTGNAADVIWNGLRHVHEEILINGRYVDPITHNGGASASGGGSTLIQGDDQEMLTPEAQAWLNGLGSSIIDQLAGKGTYSGNPLTIAALLRDPSKGVLIRNSDTGAVVWGNLETGKWVGLAQGYPEMLKTYGLIENADGTQAPNLNVPANVFGYLESTAASVRGVAGVAPQPVDVGELATAVASKLVDLLPAGHDLTKEDVADVLKSVTWSAQ